MRSRTILSFALTISSALGPAASANGGAAPPRRLPLTGNIHFNSAAGQADADQDRNRSLPGRTGTGALEGGTGSSLFRNGVNDFNLSGQAQSAPLRAGTPRLDRQPPIPSGTRQTRFNREISDSDLRALVAHDVIVMQDRSSSMGEREHFPGAGKMSRWEWCQRQAVGLTRQTADVPNWGVTLVLFSSRYDVYRNITLREMPSVFSKDGFFIGTRLARPMADQLGQYFARRSAGTARPLIVAVITDGKPQDDHNLRDVIIEATQSMRSPDEIQIVFLQVGTDDDGEEKLNMLDNKLMRRGARYDIVSVVPFDELTRIGLTRALVSTIQDRSTVQSFNR